VIDDLSTGKLENLPSSEKLEVIVGSITDVELLEQLFEKYKFGVVFHLAAVASVAKSVESPVATHRVNFDGTLYLLELSRKYNVERFIFASSAAVYGNLPELPKREDMPVMPVTPYGVDKFSSERYVVNSYHLYGLRTTALRFFNVYGERQDPSSPYSGVISIFIDRALRFLRGEEVTIDIFGDVGLPFDENTMLGQLQEGLPVDEDEYLTMFEYTSVSVDDLNNFDPFITFVEIV
jgi:UDP-glucose 4-epimerase